MFSNQHLISCSVLLLLVMRRTARAFLNKRQPRYQDQEQIMQWKCLIRYLTVYIKFESDFSLHFIRFVWFFRTVRSTMQWHSFTITMKNAIYLFVAAATPPPTTQRNNSINCTG